MCIYIHIYTYINTYKYTYIYTYTCIYKYIHQCRLFVFTALDNYFEMPCMAIFNTHTYIMYKHILCIMYYVYTYTYIYLLLYIYIYIYIHIYHLLGVFWTKENLILLKESFKITSLGLCDKLVEILITRQTMQN